MKYSYPSPQSIAQVSSTFICSVALQKRRGGGGGGGIVRKYDLQEKNNVFKFPVNHLVRNGNGLLSH